MPEVVTDHSTAPGAMKRPTDKAWVNRHLASGILHLASGIRLLASGHYEEETMLPGEFEYHRAGSVDEAIQLIGQYGDDGKFIAGGHSLLPLMKLRLAE